MVKPTARVEVNNFIQGIITEASPLNFPPTASKDEENFELNKDGTRERRLGIDFEDNYALIPTLYSKTQLTGVEFESYKWIGANNNSSNEFIVVQVGEKIDVFDAAKDSISLEGYLGSVIITGITSDTRMSFTTVDGILVVVSGKEEIDLIEWNGSSLSQSTGRLLVRDLWGVAGYADSQINFRPPSFEASHVYNLRNQGWALPRHRPGPLLWDPISLFIERYTKFPANSEVVYTGLYFAFAGSPLEVMFTERFDELLGLNIQAAKGYFIIDALRRGTSRLTQIQNLHTEYPLLEWYISSLPADTTTKGATLATEYSGRVFYAGFGGEVVDGDANSPVLSSYIFFSQLVEKASDAFRCYQKGDPTSREGSDIVDTDGGFIRISGAKQIHGMYNIGEALIVLADNGVWAIKGGSDYGFTATNYSVTKISSYGALSYSSIVNEGSQLFYFGEVGILTLSRNQFGDLEITNISQKTIQRLYDSIDPISKLNAKGVYDPFNRKIKWLYDISLDVTSDNSTYELILDLNTGAFYKSRIYSLAADTPRVFGYALTPSFRVGLIENLVVVGSDTVQVNSVNVGIIDIIRENGVQATKYVTVHPTEVGGVMKYSFAQYKDITFKDWKSIDAVGVDAKAFLLTGAITANESSVHKQVPYLVMHFKKTEEGVIDTGNGLIPQFQSGCLVRSQWDWADSINSGKWSDTFQAYRYRRPYFITGPFDPYDNGFDTVVTRNKLRGRGRAFSLYMETEPSKDCRLIGWSVTISGNQLT